MTIFQVLKADHKKVSNLMKKIEKTDEESAQRPKLFTQFAKEIQLHAKAEQRIVYRRLLEKKPARDATLEAYEEHSLVDYLVLQLTALDKKDEKWGAKFSVLKELIEHHVEEEESELFKKMRKAFSAQELTQMGKDMLAAKKNPAMFALKSVVQNVTDKVGLHMNTGNLAASQKKQPKQTVAA